MKALLFLAALAITAQASAKIVLCATGTREVIVSLDDDATSANIQDKVKNGRTAILLNGLDETHQPARILNEPYPANTYELIAPDEDARTVDAMSPTSNQHSFGLHAKGFDSYRKTEKMSLGYNADKKVMTVKMEERGIIPFKLEVYEEFELKMCVESAGTVDLTPGTEDIGYVGKIPALMWKAAVYCANSNLDIQVANSCYDSELKNIYSTYMDPTSELSKIAEMTKELMKQLM